MAKPRNYISLNAKRRHAGYHQSAKRSGERTDYSDDFWTGSDNICEYWSNELIEKCGECIRCTGEND